MISIHNIIFALEKQAQIANRAIVVHKADIYSGLACLGVVGTAVTSSVAGARTERDLAELNKQPDKNSRKEVFKKVAQNFIVPAITATTTIWCIINSRKISQAQITSLLAMAGTIDIQRKQEAMKASEAPDDITLFYDTLSGEFFTSTVEDVLLAEYHFNRNFILRSYALVDELYDFLGWHPSSPDFRDFETTNGWWADIGETEYGYCWIDFEHILKHTKDGTPYYEIVFPFEPHSDPSWWE